MAVSAISSSSAGYQADPNNFRQQLAQLLNSIKSGDLPDAQEAYSELSQNPATSRIDPNSPLGQALGQIGQSLQANDLNGAQQALASLQQAQSAHHHRHHHGGGSTSNAAETPATPASDPNAAGNAVNLIA